jgi:hypothetical protein
MFACLWHASCRTAGTGDWHAHTAIWLSVSVLMSASMSVSAAVCACRRRRWDPASAAESWNAAVNFCGIIQQLEEQGYKVRGVLWGGGILGGVLGGNLRGRNVLTREVQSESVWGGGDRSSLLAVVSCVFGRERGWHELLHWEGLVSCQHSDGCSDSCGDSHHH